MFHAWEDFYNEGSPTIETYINKTGQQNPSGDSVFVTKSLFEKIDSDPSGGCIKISNDKCSFLVEESSFIEITNSQSSAALFIVVKNTIYNRICGFKCKTTADNGDVFDRAYSAQSFDTKNQILSSSIAYTVNTASACNLLSHKYGQIITKETNFSNNECKRISAIACFPSCLQGKVSCLFSFSSFSCNNANNDYGCIYFDNSNDDILNQIHACNIIKNKQKGNNLGLIFSCSRLVIDISCIANNEASTLISLGSDYTATILSTFIDVPQSMSGSIATLNAPSKSFINFIKMLQTRECVAIFEPIEGAIAINFMKNLICKITKGNCKGRKMNHSFLFIIQLITISCTKTT